MTIAPATFAFVILEMRFLSVTFGSAPQDRDRSVFVSTRWGHSSHGFGRMAFPRNGHRHSCTRTAADRPFEGVPIEMTTHSSIWGGTPSVEMTDSALSPEVAARAPDQNALDADTKVVSNRRPEV
jgi:hypothetical protein